MCVFDNENDVSLVGLKTTIGNIISSNLFGGIIYTIYRKINNPYIVKNKSDYFRFENMILSYLSFQVIFRFSFNNLYCFEACLA